MRHLKSLKVRACEIRSGEEACCYSIGSKRESRPIEYFFFAFSAYIQYLQRKGEICMLKVVVQNKAVCTHERKLAVNFSYAAVTISYILLFFSQCCTRNMDLVPVKYYSTHLCVCT